MHILSCVWQSGPAGPAAINDVIVECTNYSNRLMKLCNVRLHVITSAAQYCRQRTVGERNTNGIMPCMVLLICCRVCTLLLLKFYNTHKEWYTEILSRVTEHDCVDSVYTIVPITAQFWGNIALVCSK